MTDCLPSKSIADCLDELHGSNCKLVLTNEGSIVVEHDCQQFVTKNIDEAYDAIVLAKKYEQLFWLDDEDD